MACPKINKRFRTNSPVQGKSPSKLQKNESPVPEDTGPGPKCSLFSSPGSVNDGQRRGVTPPVIDRSTRASAKQSPAKQGDGADMLEEFLGESAGDGTTSEEAEEDCSPYTDKTTATPSSSQSQLQGLEAKSGAELELSLVNFLEDAKYIDTVVYSEYDTDFDDLPEPIHPGLKPDNLEERPSPIISVVEDSVSHTKQSEGPSSKQQLPVDPTLTTNQITEDTAAVKGSSSGGVKEAGGPQEPPIQYQDNIDPALLSASVGKDFAPVASLFGGGGLPEEPPTEQQESPEEGIDLSEFDADFFRVDDESQPNSLEQEEIDYASKFPLGAILGDYDPREELVEAPYFFRPGTKNFNHDIPGASIDFDESGDYDPAAKTIRPPPKTVTKRKFVRTEEGPRPAKRKKTSLAARQAGDCLVVTFPIGVDTARKLKDSSDLADNWPYDDGSHMEVPIVQESVENNNEEGYKLRPRTSHLPSDHPEAVRERYSHLHNGHPQARACTACLALDSWCPLLNPGATYPCFMCIEDGCDCELFVEPQKKRPCENCRGSRIKCSFSNSDDHSGPCRACQEGNLKCVAGPLVEPDRVRIKHDGTPAEVPNYEERPYVACTACRKDKIPCSLLKKGGSEPPCKACDRARRDCTFEPIPRKATKSKKQTEFVEPAAAKQNIPPGVERLVSTSLSHPIKFREAKCTWCKYPMYGLFGWGERREVKVLATEDGTKYNELSGGWRAEGLPESNMCKKCTYERLDIILCKKHSFTILPAIKEEGIKDKEQMIEQLKMVEGDEVQAQLRQWCSFCASPGLMVCDGCGLVLCQQCARIFDQLDRDLESTLLAFEQGLFVNTKYAEEPRADMELLFPGGLLWSSVAVAKESRC